MDTRYEFRERKIGDRRDWNKIPLVAGQPVEFSTRRDADQSARKLAETLAFFPNIVEVRYNVLGSQQGRYIAGSEGARIAHRNQ